MKPKLIQNQFPAICIGAILLAGSGYAASRNTQAVGGDASFLITNAAALRQVVGDQIETKAGQAQNILVLSGGAAHGAFGAGVLNGWHRTRPVPKWDVVTGISTGALLATLAFLGADEDYALLYTNYTQVKTSDIIRPKWLGIKPLAAIFANSLYSSTPLKHRIRQQITDDKIRQVAKAAAEGRSLFVGTVDLARGNFYIWDMTKLAQEAARTASQALFNKYREILRASASIPGYFPPVRITKLSHVDGGTREQLFFRDTFLKTLAETKHAYKRARDTRQGKASEALSGAGSETARRLMAMPEAKLNRVADSSTHLYVIVNGRLGVEKDASAAGSSALTIGFRSISILTDAALTADLFAAEAMAAKIPDSEFRFMAEGTDAPALTSGEFKGDEMSKLYDYGYAMGKTGDWKSHVVFEDINPSGSR